MVERAGLTFGIKTAPQHDARYEAIARVWREADANPEFEHAWLWDHMMPLGGDPRGACLENWTLLGALAAQTTRIRIGHLVTSNLYRSPPVLAKMATTVDIISRGRLVLGIGAGWSSPEQDAYGAPRLSASVRIGRLAEACEIIRRAWTEEVFDYDGFHYQLRGVHAEPKPIQAPHPPILIGGKGERHTLRVVAEHADVWNFSGSRDDAAVEFRRLNGVLDAHCAAIGRDPATIGRSVQLFAEPDDLDRTRRHVADLVEAGADQVVLNLLPPFDGLLPRLVREVIEPVRASTWTAAPTDAKMPGTASRPLPAESDPAIRLGPPRDP
jgi:F420-dependent oxidoreductase-like protein